VHLVDNKHRGDGAPLVSTDQSFQSALKYIASRRIKKQSIAQLIAVAVRREGVMETSKARNRLNIAGPGSNILITLIYRE
jgi:hypothetical protein